MTGTEMAWLSAHEALAARAAGELDPHEHLDALLAQADELAELNAFGDRLTDPHRELERLTGISPLHGLAMTVKDNIDTADLTTTAATPALLHNRPRTDARIVAHLRAAGALVLAKANMHELAMGGTSHNTVHGAVGNPYDPSLVPGGSSGGSSAAVAAGMVPISVGTDTGGSCRVPASLSGCVGFRPTNGRYPQDGLILISHTSDTAGTFARTVADVDLIDRILVPGRGPAAPTPVRGVRIGVPAPFHDDLDPAVASVVQDALGQLRDAGAVLVEVDLREAARISARTAIPIVLHECGPNLRAYLEARDGPTIEQLAEKMIGEVEREMLLAQLRGEGVGAETYRHALDVDRPRLRRLYAEAFEHHRLAALVVPTTPLPARRVGDPDVDYTTYLRNTDPASCAALPTISIPAGITADGLPVGIDFSARHGDDGALLALGAGYESLRPPLPRPGDTG